MSTLRVDAVTPVVRPPMIPAIATGLSASQMRRSCDVKARSTSSRVFIVSPFEARRTSMLRPASLSRSNACSGWPHSSMTRFDTSTAFAIGRTPRLNNL
jgi:hypothetical protein